jgi:hypothetical protein
MIAVLRRVRWFRFCLLFWLTALLVVGGLAARVQADDTATYQRQARDIATELAGRVGRSLSRPVYLSLRPEDRVRFDLGDNSGAVPVVRRAGRWEDVRDDAAATDWAACLVVLTDPTGLDAASLRSTLAHEVYHCFQYELLGADYTRPDWLIEGSAEWVGEALVGGSSSGAESWQEYLTIRSSLYDREYDAIGVYAHLSNMGVNVWRKLDDMLLNPNPMAGLEEAVISAGEVRFMQTWPMGLAREPGWGSDWDATGPGITSHRLRPLLVGSLPTEIRFGFASPGIATARMPEGQILDVWTDMFGALRWGQNDGSTVLLSPGFHARYCVGESCQCRDGSVPSGVERVASANLTIAGVGGLRLDDNRIIRIRETDLECPEEPTPGGGGGPGGPGTPWGGGGGGGDRARGTSFGDPHIITYDGYRYSFQTVGEFLLSQSTDGQFKVQVRQQPVPGRQLSMNTAVALGMGQHRLALYAQNAPDGQTPVWVDGVPVPVGNGQFPLPNGGSLTRADNHYTVTWPTGEVVRVSGVRMGGALFFNVTPEVPRRSAQYIGLLGDLNGNPADDLRIRGGAVLATQDAYAPITRLVNGLIRSPIPLDTVQTAFFQQLYRQFGDSWRLSQAESLFAYAPGQSTETFSDRTFPRQFPSLAGIAPAQVQEATRLCREAGVDDWFLEGCVFDVAATGQPDFVQAAVTALADTVLNRVQDQIRNQVEGEIRRSIPVPVPFPLPRLPF